jgi:hypothetical protein
LQSGREVQAFRAGHGANGGLPPAAVVLKPVPEPRIRWK